MSRCRHLELHALPKFYGHLPFRLSPTTGKNQWTTQMVLAGSWLCGAACRWRSTSSQADKTIEACANISGRVRESGMPPQDYWETLIDAEGTLDRLGFQSGLHTDVVEFGCGYGTFTLPVARRVCKLLTFDIDPNMVEHTQRRIASTDLGNITVTYRDVVEDGYGLALESFHAALLFNILHCDKPVDMLRQAALQLKPGDGLLYATHWHHDASTPRGPPMTIRPKPEDLLTWALATGLLSAKCGPIDCPPWHYGWVFQRV